MPLFLEMSANIGVERRESRVGFGTDSFPWTDRLFLILCWAELDLPSINAKGLACGG